MEKKDYTKVISAGIVIFRRVEGELKFLFLYRSRGTWDFPRGRMEEGERSWQTAFREVREEDGSVHSVLTGDYASWVGRWEPSALQPGQALREPKALFAKLDDSVVADELARMERGSA